MIAVFVCGCGNNKSVLQNETTGETETKKMYEKLVLKDGDVASGRTSWDRFIMDTTIAKDTGSDALTREIEIEDVWTEDKKEKREAATYEIRLRFEKGKYVYNNITENITRTFEYLVKGSGEYGGAYYLVNDKSVTYDDIIRSLMSSQSTDGIAHQIIFFEYTEGQSMN